MNASIIKVENLSKQYKGNSEYALKQLRLNVLDGEIFGLLGPNGAGKTTLISILCGLLKPSNGSVLINNLSFEKSSFQIRQLIGVVPQEYALYATLTAKENLLYFGSMLGLKRTDLNKRVSDSLEHLGLTKFANKKVNTFSGGMKRRVNLIAGILHKPKVLFLDEPTVGVDVQSKNVIIDHLVELNKNGTTIIYTSHHLTEAEQFCSRMAIIDKGEIIAKGEPKELINNTKEAHNLEDVFLSLTGTGLRDHV